MSKGVEELKALNRRLERLLDDEEGAGMWSWKVAVSEVLLEMADYAGYGMVSTWIRDRVRCDPEREEV